MNERRHSPSARARSGLDENLGRRDAEKRRQTFEWVGCVVMSPCATFVHVGDGSSYNLAQVVEAVVFHQSSHS